jgi:hypothetical protein
MTYLLSSATNSNNSSNIDVKQSDFMLGKIYERVIFAQRAYISSPNPNQIASVYWGNMCRSRSRAES